MFSLMVLFVSMIYLIYVSNLRLEAFINTSHFLYYEFHYSTLSKHKQQFSLKPFF